MKILVFIRVCMACTRTLYLLQVSPIKSISYYLWVRSDWDVGLYGMFLQTETLLNVVNYSSLMDHSSWTLNPVCNLTDLYMYLLSSSSAWYLMCTIVYGDHFQCLMLTWPVHYVIDCIWITVDLWTVHSNMMNTWAKLRLISAPLFLIQTVVQLMLVCFLGVPYV